MECLKTQSGGNWEEWGEERGNEVEMKGKHKGCGEQGSRIHISMGTETNTKLKQYKNEAKALETFMRGWKF